MPSTLALVKTLRVPILLLAIILVLVLPAFWLGDPLAQNPDARFLPMHFPMTLGTDYLGRDLASRLYYGFLRSVGLVTLVMATTLIVALPAGLLAAKNPWAEGVLEVIAGAIWSVPNFIIGLIIFIGLKGTFIAPKFAALSLFNWVLIYRAVRDITKQVQSSPYVVAVRSMGLVEWAIYSRHILPNVVLAIVPTVLLNLNSLFEVEFVLSFLGLSYPDPTPTLGGILRQGITYLNFPMILYPSLLLGLITLSIIAMSQMMNQFEN